MLPNSFWEAPQSSLLVLLIVLHRDLRVDPSSLFACRMMRCQEETSTSQVGHRKGSIQEFPTVNSLVASMSMEELSFFCRVLDGISLEFSDKPAQSTIREADNVVYFTLEQFAARLHFPILSLVKQFLHVTRAPPTLVHPNVFRILMGCNVLNFLCYTPDPGPTRLADPNRSPGRDAIYTIYILYTRTLIDLFFLRAILVPVVYKQFL